MDEHRCGARGSAWFICVPACTLQMVVATVGDLPGLLTVVRLWCVEKGIQIPMAQGQCTKIISMIKWNRTSRLSIRNSLAKRGWTGVCGSAWSICVSAYMSVAETWYSGVTLNVA